MNRTCPVCNVAYNANPTRLKFGRQTTCSRKCSYLFRGQLLTTSKELTCGYCGSKFRRSPSSAKTKHGLNYCSRECGYQAARRGLTPHEVTKKYTYTEESKARLVAAASKPKGKRVYHPLTCSNCGVRFEDKWYGRARKSGMTFCSPKCCNEYRKGDKNPAWRGGHPEYYGNNWRAIRRAVRERDSYTCQRCGKKPPKLPDVHHIKPIGTFKTPEEGNYPENLVSLCHPCHMYVEWNGMDFEWPKKRVIPLRQGGIAGIAPLDDAVISGPDGFLGQQQRLRVVGS